MLSILVTGTKSARKAKVQHFLEDLGLKIHENNPDLMMVVPEEGKKSIGIKQIRETNKFLNEKPFAHKNKAVVVKNAELLTTQAQNALLKTLEEPPNFAQIILETKTEKDLLETVVSRCRRIKVDSKGKTKEITQKISIKEILKQSKGEKMQTADAVSKQDRVEVIEDLETWIEDLRDGMDSDTAQNIEKILLVKKDLERTNVALKLALEFLLLSLK